MLARAGETVQKPTAVNAFGSSELLLHEVDDEGVRNKLASIHVRLGFLTEGRAGFDCSTQHVAGAKMGDFELLDDLLALSALAGGGGARDNEAMDLGGESAGERANDVDLAEHLIEMREATKALPSDTCLLLGWREQLHYRL